MAGIAPGQATEHVKIGVVHSIGGAPLYVTQDMGYFKDEGLDVELVAFDAAQPIAVAAVSGDVDFGSTGITAAFLNLAAQGTLKIIGAGAWERKGFQSIGFMVSNQAYAAGVHSLKDMSGHSVGLTQVGSPLHYNIAIAVEKAGVDLKTVRFVPLQSNPNIASAARTDTAIANNKVPTTATAMKRITPQSRQDDLLSATISALRGTTGRNYKMRLLYSVRCLRSHRGTC